MCCKKTTHGAKFYHKIWGRVNKNFCTNFWCCIFATWRRFYHVKSGRVKKNFINFSVCCAGATHGAKFYHGKIFLSIGAFPMLQAYHSLAGRTKFYDHTKIPASLCRTPRA